MAGKIAVISDTHGLLRDNVLERLKDCDFIIHAGDVGKQEVLDKLNQIKPTIAVRGNIDKGQWGESLPQTELIEKMNLLIYVLHDLKELDLDPVAAGIQIVISGHTHKSEIKKRDGVIYLNPGSVGPLRFNLPVSLAMISLISGEPEVEIIVLE